MAEFQILSTSNTLYLDRGGQPVNGYRLRVQLTEFDEIHDVNVPNLNPEVVRQVIDVLVAQRKALRDLGAE